MAFRIFEGIEYKKFGEPLSFANEAVVSELGPVRQYLGD